MRRTDGTMVIHLASGSIVQAAQLIYNIGNEWKVVGDGDLHANGEADMFFRRVDGASRVPAGTYDPARGGNSC